MSRGGSDGVLVTVPFTRVVKPKRFKRLTSSALATLKKAAVSRTGVLHRVAAYHQSGVTVVSQ